ncbi:MAG: DUF928 domain-containing protein [Chroococcidiopsidaceae cyanobacterium CP_BM_ER_R8_30]|nr:DUF928 domain-containing protein [Chroococcidiopsidaceae cyanobacterium CP_BM_ER_R8_30]
MQKVKFIYAITLALISCTGYAMPTWAEPATIAKHTPGKQEVQSFAPPPLPDEGAPTGRSRGAAGRGNKCVVEPPLTALVPASEQSLGKEQQKVTYVWGETVAEHPTFWFYVPYSRATLHSIEFVLQDAEDNDVYRTSVNMADIPSVVGVRLPSTTAPLKIGKLYHWFFKTKASCNEQSSDIEDYVEGWVQRVQLSSVLAKQLEAATPTQQINIYTANGIWYEALTTVAKLRLAAPKDANLNASWAKLLQSAGLGDIASKPIEP